MKTNAFPSDVTQFVSQPRERHDDQENEDEKVHHLVAQAGKYVGRAAACAYFFCFIFHWVVAIGTPNIIANPRSTFFLAKMVAESRKSETRGRNMRDGQKSQPAKEKPRGIYLTSFIFKVSISTLSCSRSVVVCALLAHIPCLSVCRCICVWYSRLKGRGHYKPCKCICQPCGWVISKENISVKKQEQKERDW